MSRTSAWAGLTLILVTCLVFGRVCVFDFTLWDDNIVVWQNPWLNPPTLAHTLVFWTQPYYTLYLPVTYTLWSIVAAAGWSAQPDAWGNHLNPYLFHGLNLALHIACVLAVWRLLRRLVDSDIGAALGALIFAIHPVQVEAVAWVTATRDLLGTLFSTLAVLAYLDFCDAGSVRARSMRAMFATFLFVAALFSKPTAVVTPIVAAMILLWEPRRWRVSEWAVLTAWLAGAAVDALVTRANQPVDPMLLRGQPPIWFRPIVALDAISFDIGKLFWPIRLAIDYGRTPVHLMQSGQWKWTGIVPLLILLILLKTGRRPLLCVAIFLVSLLPLLGLTPYRFQVFYGTVADRYLYPAMIGISLGVALAWWKLSARHRPIVLGLAAVVLTFYGAISFHQLSFWQDSTSLFTHAIEVNPSTFAGHRNRGVVENHESEFKLAEADFRTLLQIAPDAPEGYRGLARAHLGMGRVEDAMADWTKALAMEQQTIGQHGAMSADFRRQLADHYAEAAAEAQAVDRVDLAQAWGERAAKDSQGETR